MINKYYNQHKDNVYISDETKKVSEYFKDIEHYFVEDNDGMVVYIFKVKDKEYGGRIKKDKLKSETLIKEIDRIIKFS